MDYPFWDVGVGYGVMMAVIAIVHVFISHFAIGGGLYLVVSEMWARRRGDEAMLDFLKKLTKFFVLVTVVAGALTGVGIWFIIGLLNPAATEVLIHNFVWGWAIEWTFFVIEITAAIVYYYGWKRMSARDHVIVGWIYFISAWLSLVVINGIITFMLTPGEWIRTGSFWDGFFNPTYWPSLVMRTGVCVMLAGLYALVVASRLRPAEVKARMTRYSSVWGLAGLVVTLGAFLWYFDAIPAEILTRAEPMFWPLASVEWFYQTSALIAGLLILFGLIAAKRNHVAVTVAILAIGISWFGAFEWFRESVRKPYVIEGYMYAHGVELAKDELYAEEGWLAHMPYRTGNDGADLFRRGCGSCHTIDAGYRELGPTFAGTDAAFTAGALRGIHRMRVEMPRFSGNEEEIEALAEYISSNVDQRPLWEIHQLEGPALGEKVYEVRCGKCHVIGGFNDKWETLAGMTRADYLEMFPMFGDFSEEMPPFTGDEKEAEALALYLESLNEEGGSDASTGL
ncbi:MAG: cytochrome ubiquinol oxidase subunit I [Thermoanaerobaculia bacterium]|nr:cytochrome ubiquinol oxidase subunit I [Thermoanaerobaculia bacterium]